jgi:hypothetical protein
MKRALETREQRFLDLVRAQVYDREAVLISNCFRMAGCDFPELQSYVRRHRLKKLSRNWPRREFI